MYGTREWILFDLDDLPVLLPVVQVAPGVYGRSSLLWMIYLCFTCVFQVALEVYGTWERILFDLDDLPVFLPVYFR